MQGGDISNGVPRRVLVHISTLWFREAGLTRALGLFLAPDTTYEVDPAALAESSRIRDRGLVLEAFHYSDDGWPADDLYARLEDEHPHHPFARMYEFSGTDNLETYLAFNPDVVHVADPLHPGRYGSRSMGDY